MWEVRYSEGMGHDRSPVVHRACCRRGRDASYRLEPNDIKQNLFYASVGPALTLYQIDVNGAGLSRQGTVMLPANLQYAWRHRPLHSSMSQPATAALLRSASKATATF
jgi:hypothetical protein